MAGHFHFDRDEHGKLLPVIPLETDDFDFNQGSVEVWSHPADLAKGLDALLGNSTQAARDRRVGMLGIWVEEVQGPRVQPPVRSGRLERAAYEQETPPSLQHLYRISLSSRTIAAHGEGAGVTFLRDSHTWAFSASSPTFMEFILQLDSLKGLAGLWGGIEGRLLPPFTRVQLSEIWLVVAQYQRPSFQYESPPKGKGVQRNVRRREALRELEV